MLPVHTLDTCGGRKLHATWKKAKGRRVGSGLCGAGRLEKAARAWGSDSSGVSALDVELLGVQRGVALDEDVVADELLEFVEPAGIV